MGNLVFFFNSFCPGTSRESGVCPGTFAPALVPGHRDKKIFLSRDKETTGHPVPVCPGTSCPLETLVLTKMRGNKKKEAERKKYY